MTAGRRPDAPTQVRFDLGPASDAWPGVSSGARFASLGSGSRGNGTLVQMNDQLVLVDCGFTLKDVRARLARLDVEPGQIDALLVTHEHSDHARGIPALARHCGAPVYLSYGTARQLKDWEGFELRAFDSHSTFDIGDMCVTPVSVPHDAREPTQFVFDANLASGWRRIGILTDLGHVTRHVVDCYRGCHGLLMESNHDPDMLWGGRYPAGLKRRIAGNLGHLANGQALDFLTAVAHEDLQHVLVGHISEENNCPRLIGELYRDVSTTLGNLELATQARGSGWVEIS